MKLYSWLRALLIFMVMSAVLMNIIPPRYEGSYKVVMRLIFLVIGIVMMRFSIIMRSN